MQAHSKTNITGGGGGEGEVSKFAKRRSPPNRRHEGFCGGTATAAASGTVKQQVL